MERPGGDRTVECTSALAIGGE